MTNEIFQKKDLLMNPPEIKKVKNNSRELLDFEYWESKIIETVKKVL